MLHRMVKQVALLRPFGQAAFFSSSFQRNVKMRDGSAGNPTDKWETIVGLEIHAQILSNSKAFSFAPVTFAAAPNTQVAFFDAGLPGTLPVLNRRCVEAGVAAALALNATINPVSFFDRKHYFYYDLPNSYQITQQRVPLAENGFLDIALPPESKRIRIERLHLEHDSGKSTHAPQHTLVDLNRSGVGLMEIVTRPEMHSGAEAAMFVRALLMLLKTIRVSDGSLAEGSLRVDANVSVRPRGSIHMGTRCEVKNINGIKFLAKAIDYEAARHVALLEAGDKIVSETRTFNAIDGTTLRVRGKEDVIDYRYMPEPDLPFLVTSPDMISAIKANLPATPRRKIEALMERYGVSSQDAFILVEEEAVNVYFEECVGLLGGDPALVRSLALWLIGDLFGILNHQNLSIEASPLKPRDLCLLVQKVHEGALTGKMAKEIIGLVGHAQNKRTVQELISERGFSVVGDAETLRPLVADVIEKNKEKVSLYLKGKTGLFGFFVAQVLKQTGGKGDPKVVSSLLSDSLEAFRQK